jgi:pimeloyl-ACP methyl ester carboxylesterase
VTVAHRVRAQATLVRWLGPWADSRGVPAGITRNTRTLARSARSAGAGPSASGVRVHVYEPRKARLGTYVVAPGLHFLGPDDPRLDRFCRVLAAAGFEVVAPFLPAYLELLVHPSAADDFELVVRDVLARLPPIERPTLFSISFGSLPAFEVAARLGDAVDGVIAFGGYADFESAVRFCVDGVMHRGGLEQVLPRDPSNLPALFLNLLPFIHPPHGHTPELEAAWREIARRTWGKAELKAPGRLEPFARELEASVPARDRELFLIGCGVADGAAVLLRDAFERGRVALAFADPSSALRVAQCPVVVCHGRDDDVIPWGEAEKLFALLEGRVPARLLITGLYGHTAAGKPRLWDALAEARTLYSIARSLAAGGALRRVFR